jgi:hypothetical protein
MSTVNCSQCPTTSDASKNGHLECFKYLREVQNQPLSSKDSLNAVKYSRLNIMQYLIENGLLMINEWTPCYAIEAGTSLECFKLLVQQPGIDKFSARGAAAEYGRTEILEYILHFSREDEHDEKVDFDWETVNATIVNGQTESLKLLIEYGCVLDEEQIDNAAWKGRTEILKYLKTKNYKFTEEMIYITIKFNNKECCEYLIETMIEEDETLEFNENTLKLLDIENIDLVDIDTNLTWRKMLFNRNLNSYPNLKEKVEKTTEVISETKEIFSMTNEVTDDVVNYVVSKYI